jgi:capsule biosynthesis phosphatase
MKNIVIDLDNTLTIGETSDYPNIKPNIATIKTLKEYKEKGFNITIFTSRNMRTYEGNIGKINKNTLPIILEWLEKYNIPYDEIIVGKPWCGNEGFYIDDKSIRPSEFNSMTYDEIRSLLAKENLFGNK